MPRLYKFGCRQTKDSEVKKGRELACVSCPTVATCPWKVKGSPNLVPFSSAVNCSDLAFYCFRIKTDRQIVTLLRLYSTLSCLYFVYLHPKLLYAHQCSQCKEITPAHEATCMFKHMKV